MDLDPKGAHTSINTAADQNQLLDDDDDTAHQHTDDHDDDDDEGDEESDDELGWSDWISSFLYICECTIFTFSLPFIHLIYFLFLFFLLCESVWCDWEYQGG